MKICFYNLQGGTGKTTIALNLAEYLSEKIRTVYVDCDLYGTTAPFLLDYDNLEKQTLNSYIMDEINLGDLIIQRNTLSLILSDGTPEAFAADPNPKKIGELLDILEQEYDLVICDLPPNASGDSILFNEPDKINNVILVSNDSVGSIANTLKSMELLHELKINIIGTVVNNDQGNVPFEDILPNVLAILPYDDKVEKQYAEGVLTVNMKSSSFGKAIKRLAEDLAEAYLEESIATERALSVAKGIRGSIIGSTNKDKEDIKEKLNNTLDDFDLDDFDVDEFDPKKM